MGYKYFSVLCATVLCDWARLVTTRLGVWSSPYSPGSQCHRITQQRSCATEGYAFAEASGNIFGNLPGALDERISMDPTQPCFISLLEALHCWIPVGWVPDICFHQTWHLEKEENTSRRESQWCDKDLSGWNGWLCWPWKPEEPGFLQSHSVPWHLSTLQSPTRSCCFPVT